LKDTEQHEYQYIYARDIENPPLKDTEQHEYQYIYARDIENPPYIAPKKTFFKKILDSWKVFRLSYRQTMMQKEQECLARLEQKITEYNRKKSQKL